MAGAVPDAVKSLTSNGRIETYGCVRDHSTLWQFCGNSSSKTVLEPVPNQFENSC